MDNYHGVFLFRWAADRGSQYHRNCLIIYFVCTCMLLRKENNILKAFRGAVEHNISQYADDTKVMLEGDQISFEETINQHFWKSIGSLFECR